MNHAQAFRCRAKAERVEIDIYDVVGADPFFGGGVSAKQVLDAIRPIGAGGEIEVRINSVGGVVTEGLAIYNDLVRKRAEGVRVVCRVDSLAGSIASVIAMAGRLEMAEHSFLMIHNPRGFVDGQANELRNVANVLDAMREQILDIYTGKAGRGREALSAMMDSETYLTPTEAVAFGLCDEVIQDPSVMLAAAFDTAALKNAPKAVQDAVSRVMTGAVTVDMLASAALTGGAAGNPNAQLSQPLIFDPDLGIQMGPSESNQEPPAPPAPDAATGAPPMAMTPEETAKMSDLETQVATLTSQLTEANAAKTTAEELVAKAKPKATDDEDEDDEDMEAKAAIVAEAIEITGCKDLAKLPGALAAVGVRLKNAGSTKDVHAARVKRMISEGKLPPSMKAKAMAWKAAELDGYLELTGGERFVAVGEEHQPGESAETVVAARAVAAGPPAFDESKIVLTADEIKACGRMSLTPEAYLAQKRIDARRAHERTQPARA